MSSPNTFGDKEGTTLVTEQMELEKYLIKAQRRAGSVTSASQATEKYLADLKSMLAYVEPVDIFVPEILACLSQKLDFLLLDLYVF